MTELPNFEFVRSAVRRPCWTCGKLTERVEINFETNLCSQECYAVKEKEYFDALAVGRTDGDGGDGGVPGVGDSDEGDPPPTLMDQMINSIIEARRWTQAEVAEAKRRALRTWKER